MAYRLNFTRAFLSGPLAGMQIDDHMSFSTLENAKVAHREMIRRLNKPARACMTGDIYKNIRCWITEEAK
jgi:hypothetical protein